MATTSGAPVSDHSAFRRAGAALSLALHAGAALWLLLGPALSRHPAGPPSAALVFAMVVAAAPLPEPPPAAPVAAPAPPPAMAPDEPRRSPPPRRPVDPLRHPAPRRPAPAASPGPAPPSAPLAAATVSAPPARAATAARVSSGGSGRASGPAAADVLAAYGAEVWRKVLDNRPLGLRKFAGRTVVAIAIGGDGGLLSAEVAEPSGSLRHDRAALAAVRAAAPFPPPPAAAGLPVRFALPFRFQ